MNNYDGIFPLDIDNFDFLVNLKVEISSFRFSKELVFTINEMRNNIFKDNIEFYLIYTPHIPKRCLFSILNKNYTELDLNRFDRTEIQIKSIVDDYIKRKIILACIKEYFQTFKII